MGGDGRIPSRPPPTALRVTPLLGGSCTLARARAPCCRPSPPSPRPGPPLGQCDRGAHTRDPLPPWPSTHLPPLMLGGGRLHERGPERGLALRAEVVLPPRRCVRARGGQQGRHRVHALHSGRLLLAGGHGRELRACVRACLVSGALFFFGGGGSVFSGRGQSKCENELTDCYMNISPEATGLSESSSAPPPPPPHSPRRRRRPRRGRRR